MADYTEEDIEVARHILEFQKLLRADMATAFPKGILAYHLTALAGSILEMLLRMCPEGEKRQAMWEALKSGMDQRFEDGRL
jgi:hypothetical protein